MSYGNFMTNAQIKGLRDEHLLILDPFVPERLRLAQYRLTAGRLLTHVKSEATGMREPGLSELFNCEGRKSYIFEPNQYLVLEVVEHIVTPEGVFAEFIPASALIECGFDLVAGKLDPGYGNLQGDRQHIIFGIKNLLEFPNKFEPQRGFAHAQFIDLRGARQGKVKFSDRELKEFNDRNPEAWSAGGQGSQ